MADLFRRSDLQELIEHEGAPVVSVFLPTHPTADGGDRQDPIRLRNLLDLAEIRLVERGMRSPEAGRLLAPARELQAGGPFWSYQGEGLAVFLAHGWSRVYRVPATLAELVVVGDRCHVTPVLDLLCLDRRFFVLALSQNEARLLEGSRQSVQVVDLAGVPQSLSQVLAYDDLEKVQNLHVAARGGRGARAVFHGHGSGGEVDRVLLERWVRALDHGLEEILRGERAPLVLAGVGYERAMFRAATRYPNVLADGIDGNPERLSAAQLHERAWGLVEPVVVAERDGAAARYLEAAGRGEAAASRVEDVVRAAGEGRVETLFVPVGAPVWGTVDRSSGAVTVRGSSGGPGDEDLLDHAAVATLLAAGTVYTVPPDAVPGEGPAAALLRF